MRYAQRSFHRKRYFCLAMLLLGAVIPATAADLPEETALTDTPADSPAPEQKTSTIKDRTSPAADADFVPLLAPQARTHSARTRSENLFHGIVRLREEYQKLNNGTYDVINRLSSHGSVERLYGNRLSLNWDAQLSYRNGNSYTAAPEYKQPRLYAYQLFAAQKENDDGIEKLGRFIPIELPGLGYVDGLQVERKPDPAARIGVIAGARPEPRELGVWTRELLTAAYGSYEAGSPGARYFAGTLGLFQTTFGGVRDELALLADQRSDLGPLTNFLSSQVDFNSGAAQVHKEVARLTRLNLNSGAPLNSKISLRAGLDHFERPDTAAQRDLVGIPDPTVFDDHYWRYWVGSRQGLPWKLQLDEELGMIDSPGQSRKGQVRGVLTRQGLFGLAQALASATGYTLNQIDGHGVGTLFTLIFPLLDNRLNLTLDSGLRYSSPDASPKTFHADNNSIYLMWILNKHWQLDLGFTQLYTDFVQSTLADTSLTYRW